MATAAISLKMTIDEYLHTAFEPDAEFVDGSIEERSLANSTTER